MMSGRTLTGASSMETRQASATVQGSELVGVAVPFNEWTTIRENGVRFRERFLPGSIAVPDSVTLRMGHPAGGVPLARVGAGTVTFEDSPDGLRFRATLPESRNDIREALERGDLTGSVSIGFFAEDDEKQATPRTSVAFNRTVKLARLDHLALLDGAPAYKNAKAELE